MHSKIQYEFCTQSKLPFLLYFVTPNLPDNIYSLLWEQLEKSEAAPFCIVLQFTGKKQFVLFFSNICPVRNWISEFLQVSNSRDLIKNKKGGGGASLCMCETRKIQVSEMIAFTRQ